MQEVMQIKNILQQKTREIENLRSAVFNETSSMFLNLTRELQTLKNGSNSSNDILKLSNEIAVLKFTVENELANHFQTLSGSNMTDMFAKLTNIENAVRHFTQDCLKPKSVYIGFNTSLNTKSIYIGIRRCRATFNNFVNAKGVYIRLNTSLGT